MMRRWFLSLLCFVVPAQAASVGGTLADTLFYVAKHPRFRVAFMQKKKLGAMGVELNSRGHLEVLAPGHAVWQLEAPAYLRAEIEGSEVRLGSDPKKPAQVQVFKMNGAGGAPETAWMSLLNFNEEALRRTFDVRPSTMQTGAAREFILTPKGTGFPFQRIVARISPAGFFESLRIEENSDDSIDIAFKAPVALQDR